jgi:glutathione S-transferase
MQRLKGENVMIEVYYAAPSLYGRKVLAVLEEKGLDYEIKAMSFATEDHKKPEYTKLNPNGEIPTIVDDGMVIYESTAIIEYLNDEYPEPPLLPEDSYGRARVRMVEDYCDLHFYKALFHCLIKGKIQGQPLEDADKAPVAAALKRLEDYLGKQNYIAGDQVSLADFAALAGLVSLEPLGLGDLLTSAPLKKYFERMKKHAGYKGAVMFKLEETAKA